MADQKLTALSALAAASADDILYVVDDPGGTPVSKKITVAALFTSPRITTAILDSNGNELFLFTATGSAVNEFTVANAATGNDPAINASGNDTNIGITLTPKGSASVKIVTASANRGLILSSGAVLNWGTLDTNGIQITNNGSAQLWVERGDQNVFMPLVVSKLYLNTTSDTAFSRISAGLIGVGTGADGSTAGSLSLTNLTTAATASTGTTAIIDGSNVLRPLTSSLRFKENVRDWHPSDEAMNAFLALNPIQFDYKENGVQNVVGFGAEDLAKISDDLVNFDQDGLPYSNREHAILAFMHKILRKQQEQITQLEKRLAH